MPTTLLEAALTHVVPDAVAREINDEHRAVGQALRDGLAHARRAGELLLDVKDKLPHGAFMAWVARHCGFAHRTATLYMRIATEWDRIEANWQSVANLSLGVMDRWLTHGDLDPAESESEATTQYSEADAPGTIPNYVAQDRRRGWARRVALVKKYEEAAWSATEVGQLWEQVAVFTESTRGLLDDLQRLGSDVARQLALVDQLADLTRAGMEADKVKLFAAPTAPGPTA